MFNVVFVAARKEAGDIEAIASHTITNATVVPQVGDKIVLRSADRGSLEPASLKISLVAPLATLDGFFVELHVEGGAGPNDPLFLRERRIRQELAAIGWTLLTRARPLDPAVDIEDYEGLEDY